MKTIRINEHVEMEVSDDCQMFDVKIDNESKKVTYHSSEYGPITLERIQTLVDKMIRLKLITLFGEWYSWNVNGVVPVKLGSLGWT